MTRSAKGLGNTVYKVEYWYTTSPDRVSTEGPYSSKGAAKGRLTLMKNYSYSGKVEGRVLELTGEWKEVS